jgi:hypothetical protein
MRSYQLGLISTNLLWIDDFGFKSWVVLYVGEICRYLLSSAPPSTHD